MGKKDPVLFSFNLLTFKFKLIGKISSIIYNHNVATFISSRWTLLVMHAGEKNLKVDIAEPILTSFMEARESLVLSCFLSEVFNYFNIDLVDEERGVQGSFYQDNMEGCSFQKNPLQLVSRIDNNRRKRDLKK